MYFRHLIFQYTSLEHVLWNPLLLSIPCEKKQKRMHKPWALLSKSLHFRGEQDTYGWQARSSPPVIHRPQGQTWHGEEAEGTLELKVRQRQPWRRLNGKGSRGRIVWKRRSYFARDYRRSDPRHEDRCMEEDGYQRWGLPWQQRMRRLWGAGFGGPLIGSVETEGMMDGTWGWMISEAGGCHAIMTP